jgi:hypothetical protein
MASKTTHCADACGHRSSNWHWSESAAARYPGLAEAQGKGASFLLSACQR